MCLCACMCMCVSVWIICMFFGKFRDYGPDSHLEFRGVCLVFPHINCIASRVRLKSDPNQVFRFEIIIFAHSYIYIVPHTTLQIMCSNVGYFKQIIVNVLF